MILPSRSTLPALAFAAALLACSGPDDEGARGGGASGGARGERGISFVAVGDGESLTVTATVLDARGQQATLDEGEFFVAKVAGDEWVLTLGKDERAEPVYRASAPALLAYADIAVDLRSREGSVVPLATVRVTEPFRIERAPSELRLGDELRIEFARTTASPSGRARIAFEGPCIARTEPADLTTYGGLSEARFDTTNLPLTGAGCDVDVTVMMIDERSVATSPPLPARGIQQRSFVTRVVP